MLTESILLLTLISYLTSTNLLSILYSSFIYLMAIGILLFINNANIYTGFLWVIDLGVGLVFFIFILHFTLFLYQKSYFNITYRLFFILISLIAFVIVYFYYLPTSIDNSYYKDLDKTWYLRVVIVDYYILYNTFEVTELNLLRDSYFLLNSFEFFLINFSLFFGLIASILLCFLIQRIFNFINFSQINDLSLLNEINAGFFIRQQSFIRQQDTQGIVKIWSKDKL